MDTSNRLRIATRLHFALLRHFDENVEISSLLRGDAEAQEAFWVCQASGDAELRTLAARLIAANQADATRSAPQEAAWARNTSGFGVTGFATSQMATSFDAPPEPKPASWLARTMGFKRAAPRPR